MATHVSILKYLVFFNDILFFVLGFLRAKKGLYLCIFLIPYEGITLKGVGITGYLVISYFLGYLIRSFTEGENIFKRVIYGKYILFILILLLIGVAVFFNTQDYSNFLWYYYGYRDNPPYEYLLNSLVRYLIYIASGISIYILICNEVNTINDIKVLFIVFMLSLSYIIITWIGSYIFDFGLPSFLHTHLAGGGDTPEHLKRFAGYNGEYGLLSEYCAIVIAFSSFFLLSYNSPLLILFSITTVTFALAIAISTGTRAFVIIFVMYSILLILFTFFKKLISFQRCLYMLLVISFIFMGGLLYMLKGSYLSQRLEKTKEIAKHKEQEFEKGIIGKIEKIINRPYVSSFPRIKQIVGFLGIGPLNIPGVGGFAFCWHSLYYDIYIKFGILGLIVYICFYSRLLSDLFRTIKFKKCSEPLIPVILFCILLSLLIGEYARSYQNKVSFMLMYWFLFAIIACTNKKTI